MVNLQKIQEAIKKVQIRNNLKSAVCKLCVRRKDIYICDRGHGTLVCKRCLSKDKRNDIRDFCTKEFRQLIYREGDDTCSWTPLIPKENRFND